MKKIAIYGKGGIGKSTTVSNISAAIAKNGFRVMQIGCDPKADSTRSLTNGRSVNTVLKILSDNPEPKLCELVTEGAYGIICVEAGGPPPGVGCAGRGIITAFEKLEELSAYKIYKPDLVIYDVLGDVVCGGFTMPIRGGYADSVSIVTSGEMMSLYAAANITQAVKNFAKNGYARLAGWILNRKNIDDEKELTEKAAAESDTKVVFDLPRSPFVQQAESMGKTVVEAFPDSDMAMYYEKLAEIIYG